MPTRTFITRLGFEKIVAELTAQNKRQADTLQYILEQLNRISADAENITPHQLRIQLIPMIGNAEVALGLSPDHPEK